MRSVKGITDLISTPALINLDFADVKTIVKDAGLAHMGMGSSKGDNKSTEAAQQAIKSPLLETDITGATGVLINITGGENLTLFEITDIADIVRAEAHPDANIIFGACIDPSIEDEIKVTVIATGFQEDKSNLRTNANPNPQNTASAQPSTPAVEKPEADKKAPAKPKNVWELPEILTNNKTNK